MPFASVTWRVFAAIGVAVALALRLFLAWRFTSPHVVVDGQLYLELAGNLLSHGVYGLVYGGALQPVDLRMPGYPLFLAALRVLFGQAPLVVSVAQALIDTLTCIAVAVLSAELAPKHLRARVALAGLWLAGLCPFVAGYSVAVLTEVPAVFLTALALVALLVPDGVADAPQRHAARRAVASSAAAGALIGLASLVRPESPLLAIAAILALAVRCRRPRDWGVFARLAGVMSLATVLVLLPWAARNAIVLHELRFLAPRYAELPGEFVPHGFEAWTHTWLWSYAQVQQVSWRIEDGPIDLRALPATAFDSQRERARVIVLLKPRPNNWLTPEIDGAFGEIARERTARYPLRTYLVVPVERAATMWFSPRTEWLEDDPDPPWPFLFAILNALLIAAAIAGAWIARRRPATLFLVAFVVVRTAFLTSVETPEPRYVLECFPALLALAAQLGTVGRREVLNDPENGKEVGYAIESSPGS